jgi:hypothetical protein
MLTLIRGEEMHDHIAVIKHKPALVGYTGNAPLLLVIIFCGFEHAFGKCVEHAVAGAVADDEIIGKRCDVLDVEKQDVFTLLVLQGGDDFMCKFECVQKSPQGLSL